MAKHTFMLPKMRPRDLLICSIVDTLTDLPMVEGWRVEIHEHKATRSEAQNRTLWWIYDHILKAGGNTMAGWTKEDLHEFFLITHFGHSIRVMFGRKRQVPIRRSSKLSKTEFMGFVECIYNFMTSEGVVLPLPDKTRGIEWSEAEAA